MKCLQFFFLGSFQSIGIGIFNVYGQYMEDYWYWFGIGVFIGFYVLFNFGFIISFGYMLGEIFKFFLYFYVFNNL